MADGFIPLSRALSGQRLSPAPTRPMLQAPRPAMDPVEPDQEPDRESEAPRKKPVHSRKRFTLPREPEAMLKMGLVLIIALLGLIVVGEIVFQVFIAPQMHIQRINFDSDIPMTQAALMESAGVGTKELFYAINTAAIEQRLGALPAVKEVHVRTEFPDTLYIQLRSRQPVAVSFLKTEDGSHMPVLIDDLGVAYKTGFVSGQESLPVISGIEFRNFRPGLQLPRSVVPFLQDLATLRMRSPALFQAFSEFRLHPVGPAQVEVVAYAITSGIGVRINPHLTEESAQYILRTLEMLAHNASGPKVREVDFRTNNMVYRRGED